MTENVIMSGVAHGWPEHVVIHTDGASRGNPGPASIGVSVTDPAGAIVFEYAEALGIQTNNYAEYMAVKKALDLASKNKVQRVILKSDSQLLIRQLLGSYKVKSPGLKPIYEACRQIMERMNAVEFEHVPRELNKRADQLANEVLDQGR